MPPPQVSVYQFDADLSADLVHADAPQGIRLLDVGDKGGMIDPSLAARININFDAVVVVSQFAARQVRNSGVWLPIGVVGRGIDDLLRADAVAAYRAARPPVSTVAPFTFLCIGADNFEDLVTAYSLAFGVGDAVLLVIVGSSDQGETPRWLASDGAAPPVQIVPDPADMAQLEALYRLVDVVVLLAPGDQHNRAALAVACAIPLIAIGCGDHLDFCSDKNAVLIDCDFVVSGDGSGGRTRASLPELIAALKAAYRDDRDGAAPTATRAARGQQTASGLRSSDDAMRTDDFVAALAQRAIMDRKIELGWISTYNSRCGLATHSEHLLEHFDHEYFDVTIIANTQPALGPEPANIVRLWPDRNGSLGTVRDFIRKFDALFVNFHFSLIEIHDLAETLQLAHDAGIETFVTVHKTIDTVIDGRLVSLDEIAGVLRAATRLIVHTQADLARLKGWGIVDNVVLIPPGVIERQPLSMSTVRALLGLQQFAPIIGTFGFLLPPKGLQQLIHAFALVLRRFPEAMLLMLNAQYPGVLASTEERDRCRAMIRELQLDDRVRLIDEYLDVDEILLLLNACDLTIFPYQSSGESDSGAVRLGLAAGRPVVTTPLPVFANLTGVVHQLNGPTAADIADGILAVLQSADLAARLVQQQRDWIERNSWQAQAIRIGNIMRGCFEERYAVEVRPEAPSR